ncbi:MAG TPA: hypothetical protein DC056_16505, partial [Dehalococcoidia bacterium]|nr:hypothetical protein [Dehalococcoidia bacterium]
MTHSLSKNIFLVTVLTMVILYLFSETYLQTHAGSGGYIGVKKDGVDSVDGLKGTRDVAISPDGNFVYGAGNGDNAVAVFYRDPSSGVLSFVEVQKNDIDGVLGLQQPRSITISPDGNHLYSAAYISDAIGLFERNESNGTLTYIDHYQDGVGGIDGINGATSVIVSPDGNHVYAAGYIDDAISVFTRDSSSGDLTFVEVQKNNVDGVLGLKRIMAVEITPDGSHVYAVSWKNDALSIFSRNVSSGSLTYLGLLQDGVDGIDGLDGAGALGISPDGNNVYVIGFNENSVTSFSRNSVTGDLTLIETLKDGVDNIDGLDGARSVKVSPNGAYVYVAAETDDAISVFSRDSSTGALTYLDVFQDGVNGVDGLDGAISLSISSDGSHFYVGSYVENAIAAFQSYSLLPNPPIGIVATAGNGQASITWNTPTSPITFYTVISSPGSITA